MHGGGREVPQRRQQCGGGASEGGGQQASGAAVVQHLRAPVQCQHARAQQAAVRHHLRGAAQQWDALYFVRLQHHHVELTEVRILSKCGILHSSVSETLCHKLSIDLRYRYIFFYL